MKRIWLYLKSRKFKRLWNACVYLKDTGRSTPPDIQNALRLGINRFFRHNTTGRVYVIEYDPIYDSAIDDLRDEGWQVFLNIDTDGELIYTVYTSEIIADN